MKMPAFLNRLLGRTPGIVPQLPATPEGQAPSVSESQPAVSPLIQGGQEYAAGARTAAAEGKPVAASWLAAEAGARNVPVEGINPASPEGASTPANSGAPTSSEIKG